jgi:hypothetical protein
MIQAVSWFRKKIGTIFVSSFFIRFRFRKKYMKQMWHLSFLPVSLRFHAYLWEC